MIRIQAGEKRFFIRDSIRKLQEIIPGFTPYDFAHALSDNRIAKLSLGNPVTVDILGTDITLTISLHKKFTFKRGRGAR